MTAERVEDPPGRVLVIGASFSGLLAAAAAARAGRSVTILERDRLPDRPKPRPGVAQSLQPHVLLHRGLLEASALLPGLPAALLAAGAVPVDTGTLPWFGPEGWQPSWISSYAVLSLSRPLLEHVVRTAVLAQPGIELRSGSRVRSLDRDGTGWRLSCADGGSVRGDLVIDASGRSSRMATWLSALGYRVGPPETVDAELGYVCRLYRRPDGRPLTTGVVIQATPDNPCGGIGLPIEDGGWLVGANGYGRSRPGRDVDLPSFFRSLRDPALAEVLTGLEPVGELSVHRQTGNRRHRYGLRRDWPQGLLVVGDALCAFNPLYGQGIAVGATQARVLADALEARRWNTRRVQLRLRAVADLPWSVATGEDRRYLADPGRTPLLGRLSDAWVSEVGHLLMAGDRRAFLTFSRIYHLVGSPLQLAHPALVLGVVRRRLGRCGPRPPRPPVLDDLVQAAVPEDAHSAGGPSGPPSARTVSSVSTSAGPLSGR